MHAKNTTSSWIQLGLFTAFLFLLVAIPYTVYLKATTPQATVHITNLPPVTTTKNLAMSITPPPASAKTTCIPVDDSYIPDTTATPSSYIMTGTTKEICFPPALPPYPFTWDVYKDYQHNVSFEIPSNWQSQTVLANGTTMHNFYQSTPTATSTAELSFGWFYGTDPYASNAAMLKQTIAKGTAEGTIYTKGTTDIHAVFPMPSGYLLITASTTDAAFYAFQHLLTTLQITQ